MEQLRVVALVHFFLYFFNDIHNLPLYGKLILFVDDTTLINHHRHRGFLSYCLTHDMELLNDWFKAYQLSLNMAKTVAMSFWDDKKNVQIILEGRTIPLVETTKFLGITLDDNLSWNPHTNNLHTKLQANKHLLSMASKMLTTPNLKLIYYAHIYSHLVYGLGIWGTKVSNRQIKKLFAIQKAHVRIICKKKKNEPNIPLLQKQQLVEISDLIKIETTKIGHRISTKQYPAHY